MYGRMKNSVSLHAWLLDQPSWLCGPASSINCVFSQAPCPCTVETIAKLVKQMKMKALSSVTTKLVTVRLPIPWRFCHVDSSTTRQIFHCNTNKKNHAGYYKCPIHKIWSLSLSLTLSLPHIYTHPIPLPIIISLLYNLFSLSLAPESKSRKLLDRLCMHVSIFLIHFTSHFFLTP